MVVVSVGDVRYTAHMMCVCRYLAIGLLVVTAGCASTRVIPESLEPQVEKTVSFDQIVASPDSYRGKVVLLGGEVLKAKATEGGTQLEVLQLPLDDEEEPEVDRLQSKGRFLALHKEFLDPSTIVEGTRVTIIGEVTGASVEKMDEADYRFPTLDVKHLHRWDRRRDDHPRTSGPWWGVFGGVGFGGGGSRSGGGISIGF
ncbi:Starvation lipoprotein Slp paralog [Nitrospira defluvii]|uniref:Starvation lipoprotein Slp paralog n=2 Tax=Nitrospira defluvii TaxID=330214 RepID=A0ABM8R7D0_9BACT|nr:Starvation lipoprotein Slp paralog [Nitrospira defluvii]